MMLIRYVLLMSGLLFAACTGAALAQSGAQSTKPMVTLQMPALPDPVPVTVKAATTALLIFDIVDPICTTQPKCMATMVPAITSLLAKARSAGMLVLYGTRGPTLSKWLTQVAPAPGDRVIQSYAQDRFFNTDLDKILKDKGHHDADSRWLESQRVGCLYVSGGHSAGLHRRRARRCQLGHDGLRNDHRSLPNSDSV
jgi:hypothetical protein